MESAGYVVVVRYRSSQARVVVPGLDISAVIGSVSLCVYVHLNVNFPRIRFVI